MIKRFDARSRDIMAKVRSRPGPPRKQGFNRSNHSMNPERKSEGLKGVAKVRTRSTINRLQMYRNFKPKRNKVPRLIRTISRTVNE